MKKLTIIGGGPAGYAAALYASNFELEITLIESDTLGGTCLNRGCIPAKYWLHVAELNHEIDNSKDFGLHPYKQNFYLNTGQVIMMDKEWDCFKNDYNDYVYN